ncbi:MAG: OmpA family protein [Alphaproteobacteria bacterium]|nr:OmpA family protein [Alphaproteobacteria bacterium]
MRALFLSVLLLPFAAFAGTDVPSDELFGEASVRLEDAADGLVERIGAWLKEDKARTVRVAVHADERLGTMDNTYLAAQRAKALAKALKRAGARKAQVVTDAVGHSGVARTDATHRVAFTFSGGPPPSL